MWVVCCQSTARRCLKFAPSLLFEASLAAFKCCKLATCTLNLKLATKTRVAKWSIRSQLRGSSNYIKLPFWLSYIALFRADMKPWADLRWNLAQGKYEDAEQVKSRTQEAGEQEASEHSELLLAGSTGADSKLLQSWYGCGTIGIAWSSSMLHFPRWFDSGEGIRTDFCPPNPSISFYIPMPHT